VAADKPFTVKSIHVFTKVNKKFLVSVFNVKTPFFILNDLKDFNGIIGLDLLKHTSKELKKSSLLKRKKLTS